LWNWGQTSDSQKENISKLSLGYCMSVMMVKEEPTNNRTERGCLALQRSDVLSMLSHSRKTRYTELTSA